MTVKGNTHWPPACNINDSRTPPKGCGANLTQIGNNGNQNGKSNHCNNGQHKKPFSKKSSPDNQRPLGRTNVQRKINWRSLLTAHQFTHIQRMDKSAGGATNADPRADGPTLITPRNMIQTSSLTRKQTKRRSSSKDKSTWEKDWHHSAISGLQK